MTKADLIERVARRKEIPRELTKKAVGQIVDAVFLELGDFFIKSRAGRKPARMSYPRFGSFSKRRRNPRVVRNPQTGEPIQIPPQVTVVFSPAQELKEMLNDRPKTARRTA